MAEEEDAAGLRRKEIIKYFKAPMTLGMLDYVNHLKKYFLFPDL